MKGFSKTIGGKILLFIFCVSFLAVAVGTMIGVAAMASFEFYTKSEQEMINDAATNLSISQGYDILSELMYAEDFPAILEDRGNLEFQVVDAEGNILAWSSRAWDTQRQDYLYNHKFLHIRNPYEPDDHWFEYRNFVSATQSRQTLYILRVAYTEGLPYSDDFSFASFVIHAGYMLRFWVFPILFVSLVLGIACFVLLLCASGRRKDQDGLYPGPLYKVPFDLLITICVIFSVCIILPVGNLSGDWLIVLFLALEGVFIGGLFIGLCMSAAVRSKGHTLWKNNILACIPRGLWLLIKKLPLVWRTALGLLGFGILNFLLLVIGFNNEPDIMLFFLFLEAIAITAAVIYLALCLRTLQKSGEALAAGDLSYRTDTSKMILDFKRHGENLNSIAQGMNAAVEERLKSERMKTELITNVSHDLKTPLTSVINYADLISKEPCENEKITEYAQVLTRQSQRLHRLIEDLVEASKAATGNLEVAPTPCEAAVLLSQAAGEYSQRLSDHGLTLVTRWSDAPCQIMADGRRMWRVFDNLMNNICKYALPGTRVYLSLEQMSGNAVITFKNTSREQLNISEQELMERFVRADSSRSTEGNGLGLSIARSLTELQGGSLRLFIDGDLFKAILIFPIIADNS